MLTSSEQSIRAYLSIVVDCEIEINDKAFVEAKIELFDNPRYSFDPDKYLFDSDYYISQCGCSFKPNETPIRHFFEIGYRLGLSPHPMFDVKFIKKSLGKLPVGCEKEPTEDETHNILLSVLTQNRSPSMPPNPFFNYETYVASVNASIAKGIATVPPLEATHPIMHYLANWRKLHAVHALKFSSYFDPVFYDMQATRRVSALRDPLSHYLRVEPKDRHDCNPRFHAMFYRHSYKIGHQDCLAHFLAAGAARGHLPNPYAAIELGLDHLSLPITSLEKLLIDYVALRR